MLGNPIGKPFVYCPICSNKLDKVEAKPLLEYDVDEIRQTVKKKHKHPQLIIWQECSKCGFTIAYDSTYEHIISFAVMPQDEELEEG